MRWENAIGKANVLPKHARELVVGSFWLYEKVYALSRVFVENPW